MKEGRLWASYDYDENVKLASSYYKSLSQLSVVLFSSIQCVFVTDGK